MLVIKETLGRGICKAEFPDIWPSVRGRIADVISTFYEAPVPAGFYPHFNEVAFRMTLLRAVPELAALQAQVRQLLDAELCALVIDSLHFDAFEEPVRNQLLYALCQSVGFATPSSQHQATLLWDVKLRPTLEGREATYSEHNHEADLHTDSQSYPMPEEYLALYVRHAARCGGGQSLFLGIDALRDSLAATAQGREALHTLSTHAFPFAISAGEGGGPHAQAITLATVLGDKPGIRFRRDVLEKGFEARRDLDTPQAREAIEVLLGAMTGTPDLVTYDIPDGGIALCSNHRLLHGRAAFSDASRHLIRVRMSGSTVAANVMQMLQENASFTKALLS